MRELQKEQNTKFNAAKGQFAMAKQALKAQNDALDQAKAWLANTKKEKAALEKKIKDKKDALGSEEKAMMGRIKDYKKAAKDLDKFKPEIVRLHGLKPEK